MRINFAAAISVAIVAQLSEAVKIRAGQDAADNQVGLAQVSEDGYINNLADAIANKKRKKMAISINPSSLDVNEPECGDVDDPAEGIVDDPWVDDVTIGDVTSDFKFKWPMWAGGGVEVFSQIGADADIASGADGQESPINVIDNSKGPSTPQSNTGGGYGGMGLGMPVVVKVDNMGRIINSDEGKSTLALIHKVLLLEQELEMLQANRMGGGMCHAQSDSKVPCAAQAASVSGQHAQTDQQQSTPAPMTAPVTSPVTAPVVTRTENMGQQHSEMEKSAAAEIMGKL